MTTATQKGNHPAAAAATRSQRLSNFLRYCGVETHGIAPIPEVERVDTRNYQLFLLWFSANMNIPTLVVGAGGPVVFKLSFLNTAINLLITDAFGCIIPAYLHVSSLARPRSILIPLPYTQRHIWSEIGHTSYGPGTVLLGVKRLRTPLFVYLFCLRVYGIAIPSFLNVLSMIFYLFSSFIIGGQILAMVSSHLTPTTGIVIVALISLVVSFCGYKILHWFEAVAWIPTVLGLCVMLGIGRHHLASGPSYPPPTIAATLSFAAAVAAGDLSWCTVSPDYGVYHDAKASSARIFTYAYLGIFLPSIILHLVGAAFAAAAPGVPSWAAGYKHGNDIGGLLSAVLEPCGDFGKFLMVLMALAISAVTAPTMYSFGFSLMNVSNVFTKVPRYVYAIIATGICIPLALVGQARFYGVLVACLDLIGYWSASFAGIVTIEHVIFRRCDFARYNLEHWKDPKKLPPGLAALLSFFGSFALIMPCMEQTWFVGPIAKAGTGDIGLVVGFFTGGALYWALRPLERRLFPGHSG